MREKGGAGLVYLLRQCSGYEKVNDMMQLERTASEARQRIWEYLHSGSWKDIDPIFRRAYAYASIFHVWRCLCTISSLLSNQVLLEGIGL